MATVLSEEAPVILKMNVWNKLVLVQMSILKSMQNIKGLAGD